MMSKTSQHGAIGPPPLKTYTLQEAIDYVGFGRFQCRIVCITGVVMMCEAMGVAILTLLGPILQCQFRLTSLQQAAIPTIGMLGMMVSSPVFGKISDKYGRKWVLILTTTLMGYYKILAAFCPNIYWVYIMVFLIGISFGGTIQSMTFCSEYVPTKYRQQSLLFIDGMFGLAGILLNVLAKLLVPTVGWRWLLVTSTATEWIFVALVYFLPESARYLLVSGQHGQAQKQIEIIAKENKSLLPAGRLTPLEDSKTTRLGTVSDLFTKSTIRITIPMAIVWFTNGFCYFGISIMSPTIFLKADGCHGSDVTYVDRGDNCQVACKELTESDYSSLVFSSLGEVAGAPIALLIMSFLTRRSSIFLCYSLLISTLLFSIICMPRAAITVLLFITRTAGVALYAVIMVFAIEIFPTTCRSVGMGVNTTFYKFGCFISPLVGQVLASYMVYLGFLVFGLFGVAGLMAAYLIPIETKNKELKDTEWQVRSR